MSEASAGRNGRRITRPEVSVGIAGLASGMKSIADMMAKRATVVELNGDCLECAGENSASQDLCWNSD